MAKDIAIIFEMAFEKFGLIPIANIQIYIFWKRILENGWMLTHSTP